jgi:putative Mg2+ transporter-C (MgtC) family protein
MAEHCEGKYCPYPNPFTNFTDSFYDESLRDGNVIRCLLQLTLAQLLGGILGWMVYSRRVAATQDKIITYAVVTSASCLFSMISSMDWLGDEPWKNPSHFLNADVSRIAAAVVSGVGFLGAGFIAKESHLHGILDAAFLWAAAAIGMAIGFQYYIWAVWVVTLFKITCWVADYFGRKHNLEATLLLNTASGDKSP